MIAVDTSSLIACLSSERGADVNGTVLALEHRQAALPPVVLTALSSDPALSPDVKGLLASLPMLEPLDGYWERAGLLRARMLAPGRRARLADTLITPSCLDHDVELVTRDRDFIAVASAAGLRLFAPQSTSR